MLKTFNLSCKQLALHINFWKMLVFVSRDTTSNTKWQESETGITMPYTIMLGQSIPLYINSHNEVQYKAS